MEISLPLDLEQYVKDEVSKGDYASASELIIAAVEFWREQTTLTPGDIEELRREIMIGVKQLDRGEGSELNVEEIKAEGRRLLDRRRQEHNKPRG